ncbi:hypothetical protein XF35_08625 [Streptomyces platensis subsp. clarensis]|nr:hypothetical protein [Streptomyces platensis subsp. clarensis]
MDLVAVSLYLAVLQVAEKVLGNPGERLDSLAVQSEHVVSADEVDSEELVVRVLDAVRGRMGQPGEASTALPLCEVLGSCSCVPGEGSEPSCCCASEGMLEPWVELRPYVVAGFETGRASLLAGRLDSRRDALFL